MADEVLALFTPEEERWRVRLFPAPPRGAIEGLGADGECAGLPRPSYDVLDELMLEIRAAYRIRRNPVGVTEVTTNQAGALALYKWIAMLIRAQGVEPADA